MTKISGRFFGFFLVVIGLSVPVLCAVESSQPAAAYPPPPSPPRSAAPVASSETAPGMDNAVRAAQEEVRDPFAMAPETEAAVIATPPPSAMARPEVTVMLQGLGFGHDNAYAVIGGDIYRLGDEKNGIKLLEVRRREVDILANGGRITVPLFPGPELAEAKERAKKKEAVKNAPAGRPATTPSPSTEKEQLSL